MQITDMFKKDGWANLLSGLGVRLQDKTVHNSIGCVEILTPDVLSSIWAGDGYGKKVVSLLPEDMVRPGWEIVDDEEQELLKAGDKLKIKQKVDLALKWADLYGGSVIVMGVGDHGGSLEKPLSSSGGPVTWLRVYPKTRILIHPENYGTDSNSIYFDSPEILTIQPSNGNSIEVHASRCLFFHGEPIPDDPTSQAGFSIEDLFWGMSKLQAGWAQLSAFGTSFQAVSHIMQEWTVGKYTMNNLSQMLSENNVEALYNRMSAIEASKSIAHAVLLGEGEEYTRENVSFQGVPDILDRFMIFFAGVFNYPVTKLFGRSPAGMNATGESDSRNYYDSVDSARETRLQANLERFYTLLNRVLNIVTVPEGEQISIKFNPVWTPSAVELVEMQNKQAQTDHIYIQDGVLDAQEIRSNRFVGGFSFNTAVESDEPPEPMDDPNKKPRPNPPKVPEAEEE